MKPMKSIHLSLLTSALALLAAETLRADVITLQPVDDSTISSLSGQTNTPAGNAAQLTMTGWHDIGATRPLLKFDLSSIPDNAVVLSAELTLEQVFLNPSSWKTFPVKVWRMPNDDWSEATVTWNSYAQTGAVQVASLPGPQTNSPRVWGITLADWDFTKDLLDNAVTFQLRWGDELNQNYKQVGYSSKEGAVVPTLRIEYVPRPADEIALQDDSYISTLSGQTDTPFGDANQLAVTGWHDIGATRPLLKFDLSSIPDGWAVLSAELTLEQVALGAGSWNSFPVELWRMPNDEWSEATVTWNSYAQTGAVLVASLQSPQTNGPRVWNITLEEWNYAEDLLDNAVTFQLRWGDELNQNYKQVSYSSKEGTVAPTLRIACVPVLNITRTNELIIVSWSGSAGGWLLESTNALAGTSVPWPLATPPCQTNGNTLFVTVTNTPAVGNQFYRLHRP